jgi:hypothetical protein
LPVIIHLVTPDRQDFVSPRTRESKRPDSCNADRVDSLDGKIVQRCP